MFFFVICLPEDDRKGPKRVRDLSQMFFIVYNYSTVFGVYVMGNNLTARNRLSFKFIGYFEPNRS